MTLPQLAEANDVIGHAILDAGARAVNAVPYVPPVSPGSDPFWSDASASSNRVERGAEEQMRTAYGSDIRWRFLGEEILVESPLIGRHQLRNMALAIAAAVELREQGFSLDYSGVD